MGAVLKIMLSRRSQPDRYMSTTGHDCHSAA
jgi:hypothetical protein